MIAQDPSGTGASSIPEKDILSTIIEANKGASALLQDIDIHVSPGRNAVRCAKCFWPASADGRVWVPFILSSVYDIYQRPLFAAAMQEYSSMTCVDFVTRTTETDYLDISSGSGCWSYIGRVGGAQSVSLSASNCLMQGIIEHELMHNLGFFHEHSRPDRDTFIDIMWQYIDIGDQGSFSKETNGNTLGLPYDYSSVMHYGSNAFSNTPNMNTIVPKPDRSVPIGQRFGLSNLDVSKINKMYNCNLCRTLVTDPSGSITVTPSTSLVPNVGSCIWLIRNPRGKIFLWLSDFNIQSSNGCQSDYLRVYDGNSKTSPSILDKTCGQGSGLSVYSGENMLVEYVYSGSISSNRFNATYNTATCGGAYTNMTGTVTSPNYPNRYPPSTDCTWSIVAPPGYKISLNMVSVYFAPQIRCIYDSLNIYDDAKPSSPLVGTYCTPSPGILTSYGNTLRLVFHSNYFMDNGGFKVTYTFFRFPVLLTDQTGSFSSPSYPSVYANNASSLWQIELPANKKVFLWFDTFNIRNSVGCTSDYVKVYDGNSQTSHVLLDKMCGAVTPLTVVASSNQMMVEFVSNSFIAGNTFKASYGTAIPWIVLTATNGYIFPVNYQSLYPSYDGSLWLIQIPSDQILLEFSTGTPCISDSIKVYDGSSRLAPVKLDRACASGLLPPLVSSGNTMLVEFINRGPIVPNLFRPSYSTVSCGGTFISASGSVTSPGYPGNYPLNTDCTWTIIAPVGNKVSFITSSFSLENNPICHYDYLMIYNGVKSTSSTAGTYCGTGPVPPVLSTGNTLILQFHSDESEVFAGFLAKYSFVSSS